MSIVVRTLNDEDADPRHRRYMQLPNDEDADPRYRRYVQLLLSLSLLASHIGLDGYQEAERAILDGLDSMPLDLPGLPRQRERVPPVSHDQPTESGDES